MHAMLAGGMAFYSDTLTAIRAAITARLNGGAVDSYMIGGDDIRLVPLEKLFELEAKFAPLAASESGTPRTTILTQLRPTR